MRCIATAVLITAMFFSCSKAEDRSDVAGTPGQKKICALTFDDGPSADAELTALVLDNLKKHDVRATFFLIGKNLNADTKPVVQRMVAEKHQIGNHGWSSDKMTFMSAEQVKDAVNRTNAVIKQYSGVTPKFFRAPHLAANRIMYSAIDLPFVSGVLGYDWRGGGCDTEEKIVEKIMGTVQDGAIILLHDVQPKPHPTPGAVDALIIELKKQGYELVTLSELFKRKGIKPDASSEFMYVYVE